jgi:nitrous oxide reductase accessory protein NosL
MIAVFTSKREAERFAKLVGGTVEFVEVKKQK